MRRLLIRLAAVFCLLLLVPVGSQIPARAQAGPSLPPGFHADLYAGGLANPTALAFGPDHRLYAAQENGRILAIGNHRIVTVASGFAMPLGLAWHGHILYVSWTGRISALTPARGYGAFRSRVVVSGLPNGRHQNDGIAFRDNWMYVGVGSTCNACVEKDRRSATIMRFRPNGSHGQIVATGLRNPYGLAFRPHSGQLYATDNGRDDHDDSVPDELNRIVPGARYGWPNCWGRSGGTNCRGTTPPAALFEPHASADGLLFYTGHTFSSRYRGDAFAAEWGDDATSLGTGHRVKDVHFAGGRITVSDFATGLSHPLALVMAPDGSVLVADWGTGVIWRIQATGH